MDTIWQWGLEFIRTLQLIHGPLPDALFKAVTFLGEEQFYLLLLPFLLWCVDFTIGLRLAVTFLLSTYVNVGLKDFFAQPRPFQLDPSVQLHPASGYGLPSGHSQSVVVAWGVIAAEFRRRWLWAAALLLMAAVGLSRVYLGVHFPTDVLAGWAVGGLILGLYLWRGRRVEEWLRSLRPSERVAAALLVPLGLLLLHPAKGTASPLAVLAGMGVGGEVLLRRVGHFRAAGPVWQRVARYLVGTVGILLIYVGLSALFPAEGEPLYFTLRIVRYFLVGLWAGLVAPWLFVRLRLAPPPAS